MTERWSGGACRLLVLAGLLLLAGCAGMSPLSSPGARGPVSDSPVKVGKPYQVQGIWYYPADDRAYDELGYASWYGDAFHGGPTANGERFDMDMVGAAHKTLPLPSYVEVTALDTGKTILVRVNDRGPFVANRIIDLSRRSAKLLGIDRQGVARVRVRRVEPPEADRLALRSGRPASARADAAQSLLAQLDRRFRDRFASPPAAPPVALATLATPAAASGSLVLDGWFVQVGAFGDHAQASSIASQLDGALETVEGGLFRVRLGPFFDQANAKAALARAQGQGYQGARIVAPRSLR